jgi:predicted Fe-Mo cluster-binding NifX family protein
VEIVRSCKKAEDDAEEGVYTMKIAIASDNQQTIAHHFGRARGFVVFDLENCRTVGQEYRLNIGKNSGQCGSCDHSAMIKNVHDCEFVISYGMGRKIYDDLLSNSITPIVTEEKTVEKALEQFLKQQLKNHPDKLH